jgi:glycosyltransferase involved in cell wall biosynthesis
MYNVARFVREAAESVLSQSWQDLELLAVDDGSTDSTAREIEEIRDPRVLLLREPHRGVAAARNAGLRSARGRYIAFLDADDVWLPGKLERDVAYLDADPEADLVFSAMRMVDESGRGLGRTIRRWSGVLTPRDLLIENMIGADTVLMRRAAFEQTGWFDENLPAGSDYDYLLRLALLRPNNLHGASRVSALYRRRAGQVSSDWTQQLDAWKKIMAKMRALCPERVVEIERPAAGMHRALAATAYENGEQRRACFSKPCGTPPAFSWQISEPGCSVRRYYRRACCPAVRIGSWSNSLEQPALPGYEIIPLAEHLHLLHHRG